MRAPPSGSHVSAARRRAGGREHGGGASRSGLGDSTSRIRRCERGTGSVLRIAASLQGLSDRGGDRLPLALQRVAGALATTERTRARHQPADHVTSAGGAASARAIASASHAAPPPQGGRTSRGGRPTCPARASSPSGARRGSGPERAPPAGRGTRRPRSVRCAAARRGRAAGRAGRRSLGRDGVIGHGTVARVAKRRTPHPEARPVRAVWCRRRHRMNVGRRREAGAARPTGREPVSPRAA